MCYTVLAFGRNVIFSLAEKAKMYATVAQSVEQLIRNQQVAGSSPASSSILKMAACQFRLAALFTGFRPTFHRRSGAAFSFLSFFFRAASPVTRLLCFAFLFFLPRRIAGDAFTLFRFFIFTSQNAIPSQTLPFPPVFIVSFAFCSLQVRPVAPY